MRITIDNKDLFELTPIQKRVIKHYIDEDVFEEDMKRRVKWILTHLYEQAFKKLKEEWDDKLLANNVNMIPTKPDLYAQLVFNQPNYKSRKQRDLESKRDFESKNNNI